MSGGSVTVVTVCVEHRQSRSLNNRGEHLHTEGLRLHKLTMPHRSRTQGRDTLTTGARLGQAGAGRWRVISPGRSPVESAAWRERCGGAGEPASLPRPPAGAGKGGAAYGNLVHCHDKIFC